MMTDRILRWGLLSTARINRALISPLRASERNELFAVAAAFIGGVSPAGGIGKVMGSLIGALVMTSLTSGMNLMGIDISLQYIVRAAVLVAAVIFDVTTRSSGK
jgi:putative multiple sugar transport system permease protein